MYMRTLTFVYTSSCSPNVFVYTKKCTYTKHKIDISFRSKPYATCMYWTSFFLSPTISFSQTFPRFPDFRLCLSLGNRSVAKNLPARNSLKSSRPCASSPLPPPSISSTASPPSETQRYLFRKGNKIKNQSNYHPNHLRSLSAAVSVSSTSSPEFSTYAVKLSHRPKSPPIPLKQSFEIYSR